MFNKWGRLFSLPLLCCKPIYRYTCVVHHENKRTCQKGIKRITWLLVIILKNIFVNKRKKTECIKWFFQRKHRSTILELNWIENSKLLLTLYMNIIVLSRIESLGEASNVRTKKWDLAADLYIFLKLHCLRAWLLLH